MISYIKGMLAEVGPNYIVVENNHIGYEIFVPATVIDEIPCTGSDVKIYTYMYVKEDILCLYGFMSRDDLAIFKLLITVNGDRKSTRLNSSHDQRSRMPSSA